MNWCFWVCLLPWFYLIDKLFNEFRLKALQEKFYMLKRGIDLARRIDSSAIHHGWTCGEWQTYLLKGRTTVVAKGRKNGVYLWTVRLLVLMLVFGQFDVYGETRYMPQQAVELFLAVIITNMFLQSRMAIFVWIKIQLIWDGQET